MSGVAEPARVPSASRQTTPSLVTSQLPTRYRPGGSPSGATASETSANRPSPFAANASRSAASATCTPSAIIVTAQRASSSAPAAPGSRWWNGRIALNRCVPSVAPAASAACTPASSAFEWPIATRTPAAVRRSIAAGPPVSSGASVTTRTVPGARNAVSSAVDGGRSAASSCAPGYVGRQPRAPPGGRPRACASPGVTSGTSAASGSA